MHLPAVKRACTFAIALCMCDSNYYRNCCSFVARISIKSLCKFFIQLTFTLRASPTHSLSNSLLLRTVGLNYGISYVCCSCSCTTFFYQNFTYHFGTTASENRSLIDFLFLSLCVCQLHIILCHETGRHFFQFKNCLKN